MWFLCRLPVLTEDACSKTGQKPPTLLQCSGIIWIQKRKSDVEALLNLEMHCREEAGTHCFPGFWMTQTTCWSSNGSLEFCCCQVIMTASNNANLGMHLRANMMDSTLAQCLPWSRHSPSTAIMPRKMYIGSLTGFFTKLQLLYVDSNLILFIVT